MASADNRMDVSKLIELVRQRPVLYNEFLPEYHRYRQRQRAWNEVSKLMKQPVDKCQYKWRALRSQYCGYLRRKNKRPSQQISTQFSDELKFLDECLQRKRKSKSKEKELDNDEEGDENLDEEEEEDEEKDNVDDEEEDEDEEIENEEDEEIENDEDELDDDLDKKEQKSSIINKQQQPNYVGRLLQEIYDKQQERIRNFPRRTSPFVSSNFTSSATTTSYHQPSTHQYTNRMSRTPSISRYDQFSNDDDDDDDDQEEEFYQKKHHHQIEHRNNKLLMIEELKIWLLFIIMLTIMVALVILWPSYLGRILRIKI